MENYRNQILCGIICVFKLYLNNLQCLVFDKLNQILNCAGVSMVNIKCSPEYNVDWLIMLWQGQHTLLLKKSFCTSGFSLTPASLCSMVDGDIKRTLRIEQVCHKSNVPVFIKGTQIKIVKKIDISLSNSWLCNFVVPFFRKETELE